MKVVVGDFVETRAVNGLVDDILWYRNGMPSAALRKGSRMESVD